MSDPIERIRQAHQKNSATGNVYSTLRADNIAALLDRLDAAERENERLRQWEFVAREWLAKTEWMQSPESPVNWLGKHRADILREENERLRKFGGKVLDAAREESAMQVDVVDIEEWALDYGLLHSVRVTEPCGDDCSCDGFAEFPVECYRTTELGKVAIDAAREAEK